MTHSVYRDRLPQAKNREDRVSQTINYLLDTRSSDGRSVLPLFLVELHKRHHPGDALHDELDQICVRVRQELGKIETVEIPFVIVAMTHDEASDLISETVFNDPTVAQDEQTRFQQFRDALRGHGIEDLLPHYGEHREDWRPHTCQQTTIGQIISDIADLINQQRSETPGLSLIRPQPFSSDFFAECIKSDTWDQLGHLGCVIIIDAVSMFHPTLRRDLLRSEMGSNERVSMVVLSPVNYCTIPVNQLIEREIKSQMQRAFARFSKHLDRLCEFGVGDMRVLQRWLFATLPEAADIVRNRRPSASSRMMMHEQLGEPVGTDQLIFGRRRGR